MGRGTNVYRWLVAAAILCAMVCGASGVFAASLAGTVTYTGEKSGRVYLALQGSNGLGVSVAQPGSYAIRGVPDGTYTLQAFMDTVGNGSPHANDPFGAMTLTVSGGVVTPPAVNLILTDPSPVAPVTPQQALALAGPGGVFFQWDGPRDNQGRTIADAYNVYWSASPSVSPQNHTGQALQIPADRDNSFLGVTNLPDGTWYFVVTSTVGGTESGPSNAVAVTVGAAPQGGNTVSGTVSFTGFSPTGTLYVALMKDNGPPVAVAAITSPTGSQNFAIPGVPDGTYRVGAFLDRNTNGYPDAGDIMTEDKSSAVTVSGAPATASTLTFSAVNSTPFVTTSHYKDSSSGQTFEGYDLNFEVRGGAKRPVNVAITSGPAIGSILDVALSDWGGFNAWQQSSRPQVGDTYTFAVAYADGTSDNPTAQVTAVLDTFATPVGPTGYLLGAGNTTPTFSWSAPSPPPGFSYSYNLWVNANGNGGDIWSSQQMMPGQTSVAYNFDQKAYQPTLSLGTTYRWGIGVQDGFGNRADVQNSFTPVTSIPTGPTPQIFSFSPQGGIPGQQVTITGSNFDPTPANNIVNFNGMAATVTNASSGQLVVIVPNGATSGNITVTTAGGTANSGSPFTVIPNNGASSASGTYTYDAVSGALSFNWTSSTFVCNGPSVGPKTETVTSITATTMTWSGVDSPAWTRANGTSGDITGTWTYTDSSNNSYTLTINQNGTMSVSATVTQCGGGGGNQSNPPIAQVVNNSGTPLYQVSIGGVVLSDNLGNCGNGCSTGFPTVTAGTNQISVQQASNSSPVSAGTLGQFQNNTAYAVNIRNVNGYCAELWQLNDTNTPFNSNMNKQFIAGTCGSSTITFKGAVIDKNNVPVSGATVQVAGNPSLTASTDVNGIFSLAGIPAATPFSLAISATNFLTSYTAIMTFSADVDATSGPYNLFPTNQYAGWGVTAGTGMGIIRTRVLDSTDFSNGVIAGVTVTAVNAADQNIFYPVSYPGGTTTTSANGMFMVSNVPDGVTVTVSASRQGWTFASRSYTVHADAVSQGKITGTQATPPIAYSGMVKTDAGAAVPGAVVTVINSPAITWTTTGDGYFWLEPLPAGTPFVLSVTANGYQPTYSHNTTLQAPVFTAGRAFTMFTPATVASWPGVVSGTAVIRSRVVNAANPDNGYLGGVTVTAVNDANPSQTYPVTYFDGTNYGGNVTYPDATFMIPNIPDGTTVRVTAVKNGWSFQTLRYTVHANAVSQGRIKGSPLMIGGFTPTSGATGMQVTITGSGFGSGSAGYTVKFNGQPAAINSWSDAQIVVTVPGNASTGPITVTNSFGVTAVSSVNFTVPTPAAGPQISGFSPMSGPVGTNVTINGSGFGNTSNGNTVKFNGTPALINGWSDGQITATVPNGTSTGAISVTVGGQTATTSTSFTVTPPSLPAIQINGFTPQSGEAGTTVTITGSGFGASVNGSSVKFNGMTAGITAWGDTEIVATVPNGATTGPVSVTVGGETAATGSSFTVNLAAPQAPTVAFSFPPKNGTDIPVKGALFVNFDQQMDGATINAQTFSLKNDAGAAVPGTITTRDSTYVFLPATPLAFTKTYTATLTTGIKSIDGGALASPYSWSFTTAATATNSFTLQNGGVFSPETQQDSAGLTTYLYEQVQLANDNTHLTEARFKYDLQSGQWVTTTQGHNDQRYSLTDSGWQPVSDGPTAGTVAFNNDGTFTWTNTLDGRAQRMEPVEYNLAGQPFDAYANPNDLPVPPVGNYPTGSKAYIFRTTALTDDYHVYVWNNGTDPTDYNFVQYWDNAGSHTVTSLTDLPTIFAPGQQALPMDGSIGVLFGEGGTASFVQFANHGQEQTLLPTAGTWEYKTVKGVQLLVVHVPAAYKTRSGELFYAAIAGVVKQGEWTPVNTLEVEPHGNYNRTAFYWMIGKPNTAPAPTITGFNPASGAAGITVTITGTNFDSTPANNTVEFNGIAATVKTASSTSLSVTVPATATTGKITVTTAGGTAASATNFTVVVNGRLSVTPSSLNFGAVQPGTTSAPKVVTFKNSGTGPLTVTTAEQSGDPSFSFTSDGSPKPCPELPHTFAAGEDCTVNVTFSPAAAGQFTGSMTVASNDPNSPLVVTAAGTGVGPTALFLDFLQDGAKVTLSASLFDSAGDPVAGRSITFTEGAVARGTAKTDVTGKATLILTAPLGTHTYGASFAGDSGYGASQADTVAVLVAKVVLSIPANGAVVTESTPVFSWEAYNGASLYHLQVSTTTTFSPSTVQEVLTQTTSAPSPALAVGKPYYWRVYADSGDSKSVPSDYRTITYRSGTNLELAPPAVNGLNVTLTATLTDDDGNPVAGNTVYLYDGATMKALGTTLGDGSFTKTFAATLGSHSFTAVFKGTTGYAPVTSSAQNLDIAKVSLVAPATGAVVNVPVPEFSWTTYPGATSYHIQIATASTFAVTSLLVDAEVAETVFSSDAPLAAGRLYYWRVYAVTPNGTSVPSDFRTVTYKAGTSLDITGLVQDGLKVTVTAALTDDDGNPVPGALVYFYDGATMKASGATLPDGTVTKAITVTAGSHSFTAVFKGTTAYGSSATTPQVVTVAKVVLAAPLTATVVQTPMPEFSWNPYDGAISYHLQVATAATFAPTSLLFDSEVFGTSFASQTPLLRGKMYYWRVYAVTPTGKSIPSDYRTVTYKAPVNVTLEYVGLTGATVTVKGTVVDPVTGAPVAGKVVTFYENTAGGAFASKGTAVTNLQGVAMKSWSTVTGSHNAYVKFTGDAQYLPAQSDPAVVSYVK